MRCKEWCLNLCKIRIPHVKNTNASGAVYAEFAIVFPILFFLFLTFIDFGRLYYYRGLASASAQRGVSLAQTIAGMEDVDASDSTDPVMAAIKSRAMDFIESSVGVPITDSSSEMVAILPETNEIPMLVLPAVDTAAGETLEDQMQSEPIEVQFMLRMRPFSPWLSTMNVMIRAAGYRELALQSSVPVPVNCAGERVDEFGAEDPADCRCPGAPEDGTVWDAASNTCICGVTEGGCAGECPEPRVWNPSLGEAGGCECIPCADSENQQQDETDCTCSCISSGDIGPVFDGDEGLCICPYALEITDNSSCVCPESRLNECLQQGQVMGFNKNGTTLQEVCPCSDCPNPGAQDVVDNQCICKPVEDIDACPEGSEITDEVNCTCECPGNFTNDADPERCQCPTETLCDTNQSVNAEDCVCEQCPEGQLQDPGNPENCDCPTAPEDILQVCTGDGEFFNACSCDDCPADTPNANGSNTGCVCELLEVAGGDPVAACGNSTGGGSGSGGNDFRFDPDSCSCKKCPNSQRFETPTGDGCYCPLLTSGDGNPDCANDSRANPTTCKCVACPELEVQDPDDATRCVCPAYEDLAPGDICGFDQRFDPQVCRCTPCPGLEEQSADDPTICLCPDYGDLAPENRCADNQRFDENSCSCVGCEGNFQQGADPTQCVCPDYQNLPPSQHCAATERFDDGSCSCIPCPAGQRQDPEDPFLCRCPEGAETTEGLCPGDDEIFVSDGETCGCQGCPVSAPDANSENNLCICEIRESAGSDFAACPDGEIFLPDTCGCEPCIGDTPDESPDGLSCTCDLTAGGTITDITTICTGDNEVFQGGCECKICPAGATPDANAENNACTCELLDSASGDPAVACPGQVFDAGNCGCKDCTNPATPDAGSDGLNCVCQALEDVGGDQTQLCTDSGEFFDATNCNTCGSCPENFEANPNNNGCECQLNAALCELENGIFKDDCSCEPCPGDLVVINGTCGCEEACDETDPTGSITSDSCTCVCPDGTRQGDFHGQNRCWPDGCWVDNEFDCDSNGNNNEDGNEGE